MSPPLLEVRNLSTWLRSGRRIVKAVDDVSFRIARGETFCLVGESGSGKSISALSVMRLLPDGIASHPQGEIRFAGSDLLRLEEAAMSDIRGSRIAMIFQEPMTSLNPVITIGEQITEVLHRHDPELDEADAEARAIAVLEQVQIGDPRRRLGNYPHQLSGGQRQRVMIAMALACAPQLLIADEPTTALDVTVQAEILRLMRDLQASTGMGMLFITHDFGVVAQMAHQVGVMQQGRLVECGGVELVLRQPRHAYTRQLLAAVPESLALSRTRAESRAEFGNTGVPADGGAVATGAADPLLSIDRLDVWFPIRKGLLRRTCEQVRAVDGVSLDIPKGRIVALVGESGCGKTTLGRAILQLEKPTAGSIRFQGRELVGMPRRELRQLRPRLQIVFQDPQSSLNPRLLVETTLTEPMQVHGIGANRDERIELAARVLASLQLDRGSLWRYPHEFSGGQRQRIGIARALVLNPEFIVCDEITSALDVSVQAEILQLLLNIRAQRNLTLLFITHNIGVVKYLCDTTAVMYLGKIVEQGPTAQVCDRPQHAYTQKLLEAVPKLNVCPAAKPME